MSENQSTSPVLDRVADVPVAPRVGHGRGGDTLGIAWLNGSFQVVTFRRQQLFRSWACPEAVQSMVEFAAALDQALMALEFGGTETFLVLEHNEFVHQAETAPSFSDSSARSYLRGVMDRFEKENGRALWVSQRAASVRNEVMYLVHRLPVSFYNELNAVLLARRLDLGRVLPVLVPVQQTLASLDEERDVPVLVAAPAGRSTVVIVARPGGELMFSRTILESWTVDPARVAVELNRSLLYARQQFASTVTKIHLFGDETKAVRENIIAKCGDEVKVNTSSANPEEWLSEVAKLPLRHPVNLVSGHLRRKRQVRFVRRLVVAVCWVGLGLLGVDTWTREQKLGAEADRLATLAGSESELQSEHGRLTERNRAADSRREFVRAVTEEALSPVAGRFLAYFATMLPPEGRLTDFSVRWDETNQEWTFRIDGVIDADVQTARAMITTMRRQLADCPLRVRLAEGARQPVALVSNLGASASQQRFALEGGLFAN